MSFSIGLAVANAENEWFWSYILMMVLHVAILVTTPAERPQSARTMSVVTIGYGVAVGINHLGAGLGGTGDWVLFSQQNDFPGELGRGSLPGSIAIGLVAIGIAGWFVAAGSTRLRTIVGWATVAVASALTLTYEPGGLIIGLSSRPGNMAILAALGLALAVTPALSGGRSTGGGASSPADGPAAALGRPVWGERRDDRGAAGNDRSGQHREVAVHPVVVDQEVQHRPVVPQRPGAPGCPLGDVGHHPVHATGGDAQTFPGVLQRHPGDVEHRRVGDAAGQQRVDQHRGAAAHVDHRRVLVQPGTQQLERGRPLLVPAGGHRRASGPDL